VNGRIGGIGVDLVLGSVANDVVSRSDLARSKAVSDLPRRKVASEVDIGELGKTVAARPGSVHQKRWRVIRSRFWGREVNPMTDRAHAEAEIPSAITQKAWLRNNRNVSKRRSTVVKFVVGFVSQFVGLFVGRFRAEAVLKDGQRIKDRSFNEGVKVVRVRKNGRKRRRSSRAERVAGWERRTRRGRQTRHSAFSRSQSSQSVADRLRRKGACSSF